MRASVLIYFLVASYCFAGAQTPGTLDSSFAGTGITITSLDVNYRTYDVAIQQDGKIITCGASTTTTVSAYHHTLVRYHADGGMDNSFGNGGIVKTAFSESSDAATSMALQPDGKIVVAGRTNTTGGGARASVARYLPDGTVDSSFGVNGLSKNIDVLSAAADVVLLPDGKVVVLIRYGGSITNVALAKYQSNGAPDSSFGVNGVVITTGAANRRDYGLAMALQADGKIVVVGATKESSAGAETDFLLMRYAADGSPDNTFGNNGTVITAFADHADSATSLRILPDGKMLVSGHSADGSGIEMAQYLADGQLDLSFGVNGQAIVLLPSGTYITSSFFQQDGKIVSIGYDYLNNAILARVSPDGTVDNTFGSGGIVTTDMDTGFGAVSATKGTVQADGKLVVIGTIQYETAGDSYVSRYHSGQSMGLFEAEAEDRTFTPYPNPASGNIHLRYSYEISEDVSIAIEDVLGLGCRTMNAEQVQRTGSHDLTIDLRGFSSGNYILRLRSQGKEHRCKISILNQ